MSLQRCQRETTSTEFIEWQQFFLMERTEPTTEHFYLAQIAAEVRRVLSSKPASIKLKHFLLDFVDKPQPKDAERQAADSKAYWMALTKTKPT